MPTDTLVRRIWIAAGLIAVIVFVGWLGYMVIQGFSALDALYMTVITISTVGFREVRPLDPAGKVFTLFLILAGSGTLFYALLTIAEFAIEGHLTGILEKNRMARRIKRMEDHYIVCGYGRVGEQIANEITQANIPLVVIERNPERIAHLQAIGLLHVEGDAADDHVLLAAGIKIAKGLVAAVDTDAENVFVTLSARQLNPELRIIARALTAEAEKKLYRAGADKVVSTILMGARRMAQLLIHPEIANYLDLISRTTVGEYRLAEFKVGLESPLAGRELKEADVRGRTGALIMAVKHKDGTINHNPAPTTVLHQGDRLIVLGTADQLESLRKAV
ncbi:MAG: potassium channel family protein [Candidatus Aquicultorales bacterium]